ncbi:hypothetical protein [Streptomyces sp. CBMA152]|uniref:hypothetical protein n=1 Tax=Streptomyces sp. CBMA152 TaxID=1896312 RepID=UPI0016618552|nr:hypothetical protein [Streptomyces sp. CBMA152]
MGGPGAGEDVDAVVAECEAVVEVADLEVGGPDDDEAHAEQLSSFAWPSRR